MNNNFEIVDSAIRQYLKLENTYDQREGIDFSINGKDYKVMTGCDYNFITKVVYRRKVSLVQVEDKTLNFKNALTVFDSMNEVLGKSKKTIKVYSSDNKTFLKNKSNREQVVDLFLIDIKGSA